MTTRQGARDGRANVCNWPITTFRYAAEFGRCRGHSGHWPAERPTGLWVHGLDISAMGDCNGGLRTEAGLFLILRRTSIKAENKLARESRDFEKSVAMALRENWHHRCLRMTLMINRLPAKQSSKCRPLLFWCCWVLVFPGFSERGLSKIRFIQNLIFLRLLL